MITAYSQTHVGQVRRGNEDHYLVVDTISGKADALPDIREFDSSAQAIILMVSDGMGGAAAGEVASRLAVETVMKSMRQDKQSPPSEFIEHLTEALHEANAVIVDHARNNPALQGMGATATLAGILGNEVFIGQVGDSRAYLLRGNEIQQVTKDQSFVGQLVDAGRITEEEAEMHPRRNSILQALGSQEDLQVAVTSAKIYRGDYLLLCSDGLSAMIKKQEMASEIQSSSDVKDACNRLVELANQRGGHDNITVILARFSGKEFPPPPADNEIYYQVISEFSDL
jgi:serine/threonine protein phosphatase PrpC